VGFILREGRGKLKKKKRTSMKGEHGHAAGTSFTKKKRQKGPKFAKNELIYNDPKTGGKFGGQRGNF